ncbi:MAG: hypothetical protein KF683_18370 [Rubrivivax sp.]|nr:hypothetical protein [Rubrivivax sp.]
MTPVGETRGLQVTASIGPAGGELTSSDGRVTVTVPPGALGSTQELGIVEITSHAPGAVGRSYRITPHGLATPVPMTLRLRYDDSVVRAAVPGSLGLAFQAANGSWRAFEDAVHDAAARTLTVQTQHFSDWSLVAGVQLRPTTATVLTGAAQTLKIVRCERLPAAVPDPRLAALAACVPDRLGTAMSTRAWAVNGQPGGSAASGTVVDVLADPVTVVEGLYTAPAQRPAANPVAVSVDYLDGNQPLQLVANITVVEPQGCQYLRGVAALDGWMTMRYEHLGTGVSLDHAATLRARVVKVQEDGFFGVWQGVAAAEQVRVHDRRTAGEPVALDGVGAPFDGGTTVDSDKTAGLQLVVDYRDCTYAWTSKISVRAVETRPQGSSPPYPVVVGGTTIGAQAIRGRDPLEGFAAMPVRAQPDNAGTYAPGGLFRAGQDTPGGAAQVAWSFEPAR